MGRLENEDGWREQLPSHVVTALKTWLEPHTLDLDLQSWFSGGRSGEPVARVVRRYHRDDTDQVVLKFFKEDCHKRITNLRNAREKSGSFQQHLAETELERVHLGDWQGVFMRLAGGALSAVRPLVELVDRHGAPEHIGTIIKSIVAGWNEGNYASDSDTVGEVLAGIVRRRRSGAEDWALSQGIPVDGTAERITLTGLGYLTNPFELLTGKQSRQVIKDVFVGKAHGDLNGRNILVRLKPSVDADSYSLIDYDRFAVRAPLARDPMHLLVALALQELRNSGPLMWPPLAEVLVDPHRSDLPPRYEHFREICRAVLEASAPPAEKGWGDEWPQQCLLGLVGAGLLHLGRDLEFELELENEAKRWCLQLAAMAAETYLGLVVPAGPAVQEVTTSIATVPRRAEDLLDRKDCLHLLQRRLTSGAGGVTVLHGPRGIGKTKLMNVVLDRMAGQSVHRSPLVHRHTTDVATKLDTGTLVDYVANSAGLPHQDGSAMVRLEVALKSLGDAPVVIAVDSAENLLDPSSGRLVDPDLDDAFEILATRRDHRVSVLLVSQRDVVSTGASWPDAEPSIKLGQLPAPEFHQYLKSLDHNGLCDPDELSDEQRADLHAKLLGNPRLAELVHAVVVEDGTGLDLSELVEQLRDQESWHVHTFLARLLLDGLRPEKRRVLEALAAFSIPVTADAVIDLLDDLRPDRVTRALSALAADRVVTRVGENEYTVPPQDALSMLPDDSAAFRALHFHAASQLTKLQNRNPRGINDLRVHFAELKALFNAGAHQSAYGLVEHIHEVLEQWNCTRLLLAERKVLKHALDDPHLQMANCNALGGVYASLDRLNEAAEEYGYALKFAESLRDEVSKLKIHVNLGAMYWRQDCAEHAFNEYEFTREKAARLGRFVEQMGALQGKAFCHRRFGEYDKAFDCAEAALELPGHPDFPDTAHAFRVATSHRVVLALGLSRWCSELGRRTYADAMMAIADAAASQRPGSWLEAACLDGKADMLFCRDDLEQAEDVAHRAVDQALRINDEATLRQARTTLSMIYLRTGQRRQAWDEIDRVQRRRAAGRSLLVLALYATAAQQKRHRVAAQERFKRLLIESNARTLRDPRDFAAWDFRGFALCGLHLHEQGGLDEAVAAFRHARELTPPTPMLLARMKFLLRQLDDSGRLQPVIDVLG